MALSLTLSGLVIPGNMACARPLGFPPHRWTGTGSLSPSCINTKPPLFENSTPSRSLQSQAAAAAVPSISVRISPLAPCFGFRSELRYQTRAAPVSFYM